MSIDERELRSRLEQAAAQAGPPRFSAGDLTARVRRIRRRRRRRTGIIAAVSAAAAALAVAIPLTLGGTNQSVIGGPGPRPPELSYAVTANGQTRAIPAGGAEPLFTISPGEQLTMTVEVTVPRPQAMTALWLGITNGVLSSHANMTPILAASTRAPLRPGAHRFMLHWTVPAWLKPGASRQLSVESDWPRPVPEEVEQEIAEFAVPLPSSVRSLATVARRLRAMVLHAVASCDGAGPDWILAVRTTFGKAMTAVGGGNDLADNAADAVYLVLMKGDFIFNDGGSAPSCANAPTGHYLSAVVDAATLVTLEEGLGNRPPPVPLRSLGRVLNLR
jgi:hypothetical protein